MGTEHDPEPPRWAVWVGRAIAVGIVLPAHLLWSALTTLYALLRRFLGVLFASVWAAVEWVARAGGRLLGGATVAMVRWVSLGVEVTVGGIRRFLGWGGRRTAEVTRAVYRVIRPGLVAVVEVIGDVGAAVWRGFRVSARALGRFAFDPLWRVGRALADLVGLGLTVVGRAGQVVLGLLRRGMGAGFQGTRTVFGRLWRGTRAVLGPVWRGIGVVFGLLWDGLGVVFGLVWRGVRVLLGALRWVLGVVDRGMRAVAGMVWRGIGVVFGLLWDGLGVVFGLVWRGVRVLLGALRWVLGAVDRGMRAVAGMVWQGVRAFGRGLRAVLAPVRQGLRWAYRTLVRPPLRQIRAGTAWALSRLWRLLLALGRLLVASLKFGYRTVLTPVGRALSRIGRGLRRIGRELRRIVRTTVVVPARWARVTVVAPMRQAVRGLRRALGRTRT